MLNPFETEECRAYRDAMRRFLLSEVVPYADGWEEAGEIPWALHEKIGAIGLFGFGIDGLAHGFLEKLFGGNDFESGVFFCQLL